MFFFSVPERKRWKTNNEEFSFVSSNTANFPDFAHLFAPPSSEILRSTSARFGEEKTHVQERMLMLQFEAGRQIRDSESCLRIVQQIHKLLTKNRFLIGDFGHITASRILEMTSIHCSNQRLVKAVCLCLHLLIQSSLLLRKEIFSTLIVQLERLRFHHHKLYEIDMCLNACALTTIIDFSLPPPNLQSYLNERAERNKAETPEKWKVIHCNTLTQQMLLMNYVSSNNAIRILEITGAKFSDQSFDILCNYLVENSSLVVLDLFNSKIGDRNACCLFTALMRNSTLQVINLSGNNISSIGATKLARLLLSNDSLKMIDFSHNNAGDLGAGEIAISLKTNNSIQIFNLANNNVGAIGATLLSKMLITNVSLEIFDLSINRIGFDGAKALAKALEGNTSLFELNLKYNDIETTDENSQLIYARKNSWKLLL